MGKPAKLTYLTEGKALGNPMHKGFCDTFNWLVRFCNNLKGDDTYIEVQNELGDHPLITFGNDVPGRGGGGGGGSTYTPYPAPFDFKVVSETTTETDPITGEETQVTTNTPKIVNCVWQCGRDVRQLNDYTINTSGSGYNGGTYWLQVVTAQNGQVDMNTTQIIMTSSKVVPVNNTPVVMPTPPSGYEDNYSYFPIWTFDYQNDTLTPIFDWRQMWKLPYYSEN